MITMRHGWRAASVALIAAAGACSSGAPSVPDTRLWTDDLAFRVSSDPIPPRARERVIYKVVVREKESGRPIERGEGRIYAETKDGAHTWDSLEPGPEPGSYYAHLNFVTSGDWAIGMQFRRDSTQALEKLDWTQEVRAAR